MNSETILLVSYSTMVIKQCHYHLICRGFQNTNFIITDACSLFLLKTDTTEKKLETINNLYISECILLILGYSILVFLLSIIVYS